MHGFLMSPLPVNAPETLRTEPALEHSRGRGGEHDKIFTPKKAFVALCPQCVTSEGDSSQILRENNFK